MSTTTNLGLFKHDNVLTNKDPFDLQKSINDNLDKIDAGIGSDRTRISKNETDISSIKKEQTAQDTDIETLTKRLDEKDNQIAELEDKVSDLNNNQIYGKASGEYVHLSDSAKMECDIAVLGNSKQETREGYNLLKNNATSQTINGVTFTVNEDGTVTVNGTATVQTTLTINQNICLVAGEYIASGCPAGGSTTTYRLDMWKSDWSGICTEIGNGRQITLAENIENAIVGITIKNGVTANNLVFKPMIVAGTQNKEYEQYGATPSIDYPSEIEVVGDNINLLNARYGIDITASDSYKIEVLAETEYTLSLTQKLIELGDKTAVQHQIRYYNENDENISSGGIMPFVFTSVGETQSGVRTITTPKNCKYVILDLGTYFGTGSSTIQNVQAKFEKGTKVTTYSPYNQGSANIKVCNKNIFDKDNANILNAIIGSSISAGNYGLIASASGVSTLYIKCKPNRTYTISRRAGTRFIVASTTDTPKVGKVCSKIIINNIATNITYTTGENDKYLLVYYYLSTSDTLTEQEILDSIQIEEGTTATDYIAHEEQNYPVDVQKPMLEGDYFDLENGKEVHNWQKIESYNDEEITTEYKSTTGELSTGATVYYKLAEPRKLDLTKNQKAQLQALQKAKTYKNITNITTDTIAVLDVDYKRDLETYQKQQDDRITAIEQLLSTTTTSAMLLDNVQSDLESEVK